MGKPVSAILREARRVIERRGWRVRATDPSPGGAVDVMTAIRTAACDPWGPALDLRDLYALLVPVAAAIKSSFATWESSPGLDISAVFDMMDAAIAFAVQAEGATGGVVLVRPRPILN